MRFRLSLMFLAFALMTAACERSFESPPPLPPQVVIDQVMPNKAYAGQVITLVGQEFDPEAAKNEVYFGTELAEVVGTIWQDPDGPNPESDHLAVVVPLLAESGSVDLRLVTDASSDTLTKGFHYIGSGHPRDEKLDTLLDTRYSPIAMATLRDFFLPVYSILGTDARLVSFSINKAMRLDLGTCDRPLALAMTSVGPANFPEIQTFVTTVQLPNANHSEALFRLMRWRLELTSLPIAFASPDWIFEGEDFSPGRIFSIPRPEPVPPLHDLLVASSDGPSARLMRPAPGANTDPYVEVSFPGESETSQPRILKDAVFAPELRRVFASISGNPGIYTFIAPESIEDSPPIGADLLTPTLLTPGLSPFSLLAWCPSEGILYAQAMGLGRIFELTWDSSEEVLKQTNIITLDAAPFAMTCATVNSPDGMDPTDRLYIASTNGIDVLSTTSEMIALERVSGIPLPGSRGGPQSLVSHKTDGHICLSFTDAVGDRIISFEAGNELNSLKEDPIGSILPSLSTSTDEARIYYGDIFANVIRVIDRFSGVLQRQFAIDGATGFGSYRLSTLEGPQGDKLFAPLMMEDGKESDNIRYGSLAVWNLNPDDEAEQNTDSCGQSMIAEGDAPNIIQLDEFLHLQLCRDRDSTRMFFSRHHQLLKPIDGDGPMEPKEDRFWYHDLNLQEETLEQVFGEEHDLNIDIADARTLAAVDRRGQVVAVLENHPDAGADFPKRLRFVDIDEPNPTLSINIDSVLAEAVGRLAALRVEPLPWEEESKPLYMALLSVPGLGQVQVLSIQADGIVSRQTVQTGGAPYYIFISPDERRAYVTHWTEGKVSVIELCCDREPDCVAVTQTIAVEPWPYEVKFNNAGDTAYLTHLFSSRVSIIE